MPGNVPPVADERRGLLGFLAQQRYVLRLTAYGLTDEQARETPTVSDLSVGGLVNHATTVERYWMDIVEEQAQPFDPNADWGENFRIGPDQTLSEVLDAYDHAARHTEAIVAGVEDLGRPVPVPKGVPWFPADVDAWSVRWVLLHLIQETARHAGHADIIRESIDGATAFPLMAAVEHWPPSPWMQPWTPAEPPT